MHCVFLKNQPLNPPAPKNRAEAAAHAKHSDHARLVEPGAVAGALAVAWAGALFVMADEKAKAIAMKKAAAKARAEAEAKSFAYEKAQKTAAEQSH